jgi:4'-phosphopantetheinyl transferase
MPPPVDARVIVADLNVPAATVARFDTLLPVAERDARPHARVLRALTREVLSGTVGAPPAELEITRECEHCGHPSHGKPRLLHTPHVSFSVSHAGTIGVIAVAAADRVVIGVDIERVRPRHNLAMLAGRVLAPAQLAAWSAIDASEQLTSFLQTWTAKEAYVKAIGTGVITRLADVPEEPPGWSIAPLDAPPGYVGSVAVGELSASAGIGG